MKPKITIISLGGTIAMSNDKVDAGVAPTLNADDLVRAVPQLSTHAEISTNSILNLPSVNVTIDHLFDVANEIERAITAGQQGFVITQGTDTIEETSFALKLICQAKGLTKFPIVITGAMRNPTQLSADGSANLLAAVIIASDAASHNRGVLVSLNNDIHLPQYVTKTSTTALQAFSSAPFANCGAVIEDKPYYYIPADNLGAFGTLPTSKSAREIKVPIIKPCIGESPYMAEMLLEHDIDGLIIEAVGAGHIPHSWIEPIEKLARKVPVVLASRAQGRVLLNTYGYEGAEIDLIKRGLITAGFLNPLKARVLLTLLLSSSDKSVETIEGVFGKL